MRETPKIPARISLRDIAQMAAPSGSTDKISRSLARPAGFEKAFFNLSRLPWPQLWF